MTKHTHHEIGDHAACIRLVPIFNHLEDSAMNYIAEKAHTKQYQKGEFLFRSQEKEDTLYIINHNTKIFPKNNRTKIKYDSKKTNNKKNIHL